MKCTFIIFIKKNHFVSSFPIGIVELIKVQLITLKMVLILKVVLMLMSFVIVEINSAPVTSDFIKFGESRKLKDFQIDFKKRNKRYNLLGPNKWETKKLSYHVSKYSQTIPDYIVDIELKRAFDVWSEHIDLEFHLESSEVVEIDIR